ncbi:MAG: WD40 repeat domain-containing protein, partial [Verrucomicrobiota bacterium]|nr:WD40 repeat domain-containing protein [Verrucomicrobiota bacterium]
FAIAAVFGLNHHKNKVLLRQKERAAQEQQLALENVVKVYDQRLDKEETHTDQKISETVKHKEEFSSEKSSSDNADTTLGADAPPPGQTADLSGAASYVTDKIFTHKGGVWAARYSPLQFPALPGYVSAFLITASRDHTAGIWDMRGDKDFFLRGHTAEINDATFNPKPPADGNGWFAATASDDNTAALWRASEPNKPLPLKGHSAAVTGLAWSANGNWLVTTSKDSQVRIWNVAAADPSKQSRVLQGHSASVWLPCLMETGGAGWLVTPSADNTARVWTFPRGEPASFSKHAEPGVLHHGAPVRRVAMDSKARWVVTAGADGRAILWDRVSGELLLILNHEKPVRDVAFQPGGNLLVTASADNTAQIWDAQKLSPIVTLAGHTAPIFSARFTPYGPGVVTVSWDRTARLWNYETKKCVAVLRGHVDALWSVEFSPSGNNFTTTSSDGTARLWELERIPGGSVFVRPPASAK